VAESFLSDADIAGLVQTAADGFQTRLNLFGAVTIIFRRYDAPSESYVTLRPQTGVLVERANLQPESRGGPTLEGQARYIDGYLSKLGLFDVRPGDTFALAADAGPLSAEIVVVDPPQLGVRRASFRLLES
jgi:hypothetical protein